MWRLTVIILLWLGLSGQTAAACSFASGYRTFEPGKAPAWEPGRAPITPAMSVHSLERGHDDGDFASCSDAGVLQIAIDEPQSGLDVGYIFELESGRFPDRVFPDAVIAPRELEDGLWGFFFVWFDLPPGQATPLPIDVTISVRAVSPTMDLGTKVFLDIRSP